MAKNNNRKSERVRTTCSKAPWTGSVSAAKIRLVDNAKPMAADRTTVGKDSAEYTCVPSRRDGPGRRLRVRMITKVLYSHRHNNLRKARGLSSNQSHSYNVDADVYVRTSAKLIIICTVCLSYLRFRCSDSQTPARSGCTNHQANEDPRLSQLLKAESGREQRNGFDKWEHEGTHARAQEPSNHQRLATQKFGQKRTNEDASQVAHLSRTYYCGEILFVKLFVLFQNGGSEGAHARG